MPRLSFALDVCSLYSPAYCMCTILLVLTDVGVWAGARRAWGRGGGRTALYYRKVKSFAQGHSIRQCKTNKTNPQIPQTRLTPSTVHIYRNLTLLSGASNALGTVYGRPVISSISGTTRADTIPTVFTVVAPAYVCSWRKVGGQEYLLNLF